MPGTSSNGVHELLGVAQSRGWPLVMGVVNITPDSFSDGGQFLATDAAIEHALRLEDEGADILDLGGESTRPRAAEVGLEEELKRVIPVIEGVRRQSTISISIDTSKPEVMSAAVQAGASIVNDVRALKARGALQCVQELNVGVVLMHMRGEPRSMQENPKYTDVISQVREFLLKRVDDCVQSGIDGRQLIIDPGFGFGKNLEHNLLLLANLGQLTSSGWPVLVGVSRKSMIASMLDRKTGDRSYASVAMAVYAAQCGAAILRVHDVQGTCDALRVTAQVVAKKAP